MIKHVVASIALAFVAMFNFSAVASAAPVAVVTDVQGRAALAQQPRKDLSLLGEIETDARVEVADKSRLVVVYYSSGTEFTLRGPAVVQFKASAPETVSGNAPQQRAALASGSTTDVRLKPGGLTRAAYMMMGATPFLKLVGLSDTRTLETRPEFRWASLEPLTSYDLRITSDSGKAVFETTTANTFATLPPEVWLEPNGRYTWRVSARLADGTQTAAVGEFTVAAPELRRQVEAARPDASAAVSQQVAFALWLEQVELRDEARKYWEIARAQRPASERLQALAE